MDIDELENAARGAWPALQEYQGSTGVMRFAAGVSRRANSMTPVWTRDFCPERLMQEAESFYGAFRMPTIVRVLEAQQTGHDDRVFLDARLGAAGYGRQARTDVMVRDLAAGEGTHAGVAKSLVSLDAAGWLRAWQRVRGFPGQHLPVLIEMLARIAGEPLFLAIAGPDGEYRATAMAVRQGPMLGLYGVATAAPWRRQGLSSLLIDELLRWGIHQGARSAYLQVEADNDAAIRLYLKLEFSRCYSYSYRVKHFMELREMEQP